MSDLLAGAALLIATITLIFTLWYPALQDAIGVPYDLEYPLRNKDALKKVNSALWGRAAPLTLCGLAVFVIFLPDCLQIVMGIFGHAGPGYNAVKACLVVADLLTLFITGHIAWTARALWVTVKAIQSVGKTSAK